MFRFIFSRQFSAFLLAMLATLPSCAPKRLETLTAADPGLQKTYEQAVSLALNPTPDKVFHNLVAIVSENGDLKWKEIDGQAYVLMVSYVSSFKYYQGTVGKPYNTGQYTIWVTAAPFVKDLCSDATWSGGNLALRLEQLLGLPPGGSRAGFVQFWVRPQDLFRPCPDNEVTDRQCSLNIPADVEPWYREWLNELRSQQYYFCPPNKQGYPWTQLGYTFDWKDLAKPVGMSEFVIKENAVVYVESLTSTAQYCVSK